MKRHLLSKIGCGVLFGLFVPLGAVHAYDANDRIQAHLGGDGTATQISAMSSSDTWSAPQGAQGPIRSDMTYDKGMDSETAAREREMQNLLFPLNAQGS